jgi:hypothetical protein
MWILIIAFADRTGSLSFNQDLFNMFIPWRNLSRQLKTTTPALRRRCRLT